MKRLMTKGWFHSVVVLAAGMSLLLAVGCGGKKEEGSGVGWQCPRDPHVFLSDPKNLQPVCPKCGSAEVERVLAFECPSDQTKFVAPVSAGLGTCPKCGGSTSQMIPLTPQLVEELSRATPRPEEPEP